MRQTSFGLPAAIKRTGTALPGAFARQELISGFDQQVYSNSSVLCIGAGGLISQVAPTLCRKGIGRLTVLDRDIVEASNLSRQHFYRRDIGQNKALSLIRNLEPLCTADTVLVGFAAKFQDALASGVNVACDVAVCGIDNNPGRVAVSRHFQALGVPVVFLAVSADADHGYIFIQDKAGPCLGCLFPDIANDNRYPCPATPAILDILQTVGGVAVYAIDTVLVNRRRNWNYRRVTLSDGGADASGMISCRPSCALKCRSSASRSGDRR